MQNAVDILMKRALPRLSAEQERLLFQRVERGDKRAEELLVRHNLPLALELAMSVNAPGLEADDKMATALAALARCIKRFDWRRGNKFSTLAYTVIGREMAKLYWHNRYGDGIRYPEKRQELQPALEDFKEVRLDAVSAGSSNPDALAELFGAEDDCPDRELDSARVVRAIEGQLSPRERAYAHHLIAGGTQKDWAELYGEPRWMQAPYVAAVEAALHRARSGACLV